MQAPFPNRHHWTTLKYKTLSRALLPSLRAMPYLCGLLETPDGRALAPIGRNLIFEDKSGSCRRPCSYARLSIPGFLSGLGFLDHERRPHFRSRELQRVSFQSGEQLRNYGFMGCL